MAMDNVSNQFAQMGIGQNNTGGAPTVNPFAPNANNPFGAPVANPFVSPNPQTQSPFIPQSSVNTNFPTQQSYQQPPQQPGQDVHTPPVLNPFGYATPPQQPQIPPQQPFQPPQQPYQQPQIPPQQPQQPPNQSLFQQQYQQQPYAQQPLQTTSFPQQPYTQQPQQPIPSPIQTHLPQQPYQQPPQQPQTPPQYMTPPQSQPQQQPPNQSLFQQQYQQQQPFMNPQQQPLIPPLQQPLQQQSLLQPQQPLLQPLPTVGATATPTPAIGTPAIGTTAVSGTTPGTTPTAKKPKKKKKKVRTLADVEIQISGSDDDNSKDSDHDDNNSNNNSNDNSNDNSNNSSNKSHKKKKKDDTPVIVWEWQGDDRVWQAYDPPTILQIETAHSTKQHQVHLDQGFFASHKGYLVNFNTSSQVNLVSGAVRNVRRNTSQSSSSATTSSGSSASASWLWKDDDGWKAYDKETSDEIEHALVAKKTSVMLTHGYFAGKKYCVDFQERSQINLLTQARREVKRSKNASVSAPSSAPSTYSGIPVNSVNPSVSLNSDDSAWEWWDDVNWRAYDQATSAALDYAHAAGKSKAQLDQGFFAGKDYYIDFRKAIQVNRTNSATRPIRKKGVLDNNIGSGGFSGGFGFSLPPMTYSVPTQTYHGSGIWEWKADTGWQAFDATATSILESHYSAGKSYAVLSHGFFGGANGPYTVEFGTMTQKSSTGNMRTVRRR